MIAQNPKAEGGGAALSLSRDRVEELMKEIQSVLDVLQSGRSL